LAQRKNLCMILGNTEIFPISFPASVLSLFLFCLVSFLSRNTNLAPSFACHYTRHYRLCKSRWDKSDLLENVVIYLEETGMFSWKSWKDPKTVLIQVLKCLRDMGFLDYSGVFRISLCLRFVLFVLISSFKRKKLSYCSVCVCVCVKRSFTSMHMLFVLLLI
jgi:hypothetical protein